MFRFGNFLFSGCGTFRDRRLFRAYAGVFLCGDAFKMFNSRSAVGSLFEDGMKFGTCKLVFGGIRKSDSGVVGVVMYFDCNCEL